MTVITASSKHTCSFLSWPAGLSPLSAACLQSTRQPAFRPPPPHQHHPLTFYTPPPFLTPCCSPPRLLFLPWRRPSSNTRVHLLSAPHQCNFSQLPFHALSLSLSMLSHTGIDATPQSASPVFTWRREIPMQLPILYSMSSSGEVTLALHGWQSTFLQNCILISQSQHCQSRQNLCWSYRVSECARLCVCKWLTNALHCIAHGAPVTCIFSSHCYIKNLRDVKGVQPDQVSVKKKEGAPLFQPHVQLCLTSRHGWADWSSALEGKKHSERERGRDGRQRKGCLSL